MTKKSKRELPAAPDEAAPTHIDFKDELVGVIPHLRAFARSLTGRADLADDLVQETLLKAWAARDRYAPGTRMKSWTFVILRNSYLTLLRRSRFRGEIDEESIHRMLSAPAGQDHTLHLSDVQRGLLELPASQREALILVGAGGFSYEEAAEICECAVGTVKSRVARARVALEKIITEGGFTDSTAAANLSDPHAAILASVDRLSGSAA